jgi:TonB-dependent Receptor Plug Domain/CarboxypepD_reg-like domain
MKKLLFILSFFVLKTTPILFAQQKFTISGYVQDESSSEKLISAAVFDTKSASGVVSNTYGFYSLTLPRGTVNLSISYVGYKTQNLSFLLRGDTIINFNAKPDVELQTVEISATKQNRIENRTQMSQVTVPIAQIKKIPALFGEVDVLKALQLLPGVQAGGEGQNGLYVRGGSPDQNLILLDGVPVYNVSHVGGFFSVFNGDAIRNVTLTKGGFPARFGGRLSSIIEIDMKEGNMKEFHGEGGIGLITSRATVEGPIKKDVASFMVSARRTYIDAILTPIIKAAANATRGNQVATTTTSVTPRLYFYDINGKINWKLSEKNRLYLSAYTGKDVFGFGVAQTSADGKNVNTLDGGTDWGNITTAMRWNSLISNKLFANTTLTYSRYNVNILSKNSTQRDTIYNANVARYDSGIEDFAGKIDFDYVTSPKHHFRFGTGATRHAYNPGATQLQLTNRTSAIDTTLGLSTIYSTEPYIYVEDEMQLGALKANLGVHGSGFSVGKTFYKSIQPRLGLNYPLSNSVALKAAFTTMRQYINLLTNERIGLPTDLWVPATEKIKPQDSWQAAIGAAKTVKEEYEVSIEAYYKDMQNVISYKEGANYLNTNDWESKIAQGHGWAYGLEFFVQKKIGKLTGWAGYTLSWNKRQFDEINGGKTYDFKYDRRNDLKATATYRFSEKFNFSASWQYGTGNATSLPEITYSAPQRPENVDNPFIGGGYRALEIIGDKNSFRMPAYHRLDVNFEFMKQKKRYLRTWSIGAYNAYSRANPVFLYRDSNPVTVGTQTIETPVIRQFSLFPIIPSVAYGFKF